MMNEVIIAVRNNPLIQWSRKPARKKVIWSHNIATFLNFLAFVVVVGCHAGLVIPCLVYVSVMFSFIYSGIRELWLKFRY